MDNRTHLLDAITNWQAVKANPAFKPDSAEWISAHTAFECALFAAGVYKEALRGRRLINEQVRTHTEEPERTFYHWAYSYAVIKPESLKELQKAKSYLGRSVILDGIQASFNKVELKKEEIRKAACRQRTADLIEEARQQAGR